MFTVVKVLDSKIMVSRLETIFHYVDNYHTILKYSDIDIDIDVVIDS